MIVFGLFIALVLIEYFLSPRIDWYICDVQEDVQIYQVILWYNTKEGREFNKLFKI